MGSFRGLGAGGRKGMEVDALDLIEGFGELHKLRGDVGKLTSRVRRRLLFSFDFCLSTFKQTLVCTESTSKE